MRALAAALVLGLCVEGAPPSAPCAGVTERRPPAVATERHRPEAPRRPAVVLNEADFRDRVYACWLGKNIGGTLGMPFEGAREVHDITFFTPVPTTPAANDDLDLQVLWLKAMEERGPRMTARILGEYWLKYVPVDWNEYGVGKANMRAGLPPPLSGQVRNKQWRDSNGAWIRSEIWACLAPGDPALAARYAWEDACVDHGGAEGTYAELFTASLESAAFVERDRDRLLAIGLAYVPPECGVAKAVRAAVAARARGLDLKAARAEVVRVTEPTGWFQAPRNVAFTVLGWLYGDGDFGKSICAAVNCGDDTDCTGATLGALFGILRGTAGIPDAWRKPVGTGIQNVAISGFAAPRTLEELTGRTVAVTRKVAAQRGSPVVLASDRATDLSGAGRLRLVDRAAAKALWARSPYAVTEEFGPVRASLDFGREPTTSIGGSLKARLRLHNDGPGRLVVVPRWRLPAGLEGRGVPGAVRLSAGEGREYIVELTVADVQGDVAAGELVLETEREKQGVLPFAVLVRPSVHARDLALARLGASATADSELDREPGCAAKAVDGEIPAPDAFEGHRWHSALTPHPHWVAVHLPAPKTVSRVIVHFADPAGHPVDFDCQASDDGVTWRALCEVRDCADARRYDRSFAPAVLRHFRLLIRRSSSAHWPDAAQVGEIELLP